MKQFVDKTILKRLCNITKLEIKDEEVATYLNLINKNLEVLEKIDAVNTDGLEPLNNPYKIALRKYSDKLSDGDKVEEIMNVAPKQLYNYFVVPKVLDK
jgi:aspartyl-tRNA(Asn)/glutamyl-tRNA(Gln) amidotransferase subunit C